MDRPMDTRPDSDSALERLSDTLARSNRLNQLSIPDESKLRILMHLLNGRRPHMTVQ